MADGRGDPYRLKRYWTKGKGLKRWASSAHPWTALYRHLRKHMPNGMAKRVTSQWFKDVFGIWPGERKGKNPTGREIKKEFDPDQPRNPANGRWWRAQLTSRNPEDLLDPGYQFSHTYSTGDAEVGVSAMESLDDLAFYFANPESAALTVREDTWSLIELEGEPVPGARPADAHLGEVLVRPTKIVSVRPVDEQFMSMITEHREELERIARENSYYWPEEDD